MRDSRQEERIHSVLTRAQARERTRKLLLDPSDSTHVPVVSYCEVQRNRELKSDSEAPLAAIALGKQPLRSSLTCKAEE